MLRWIALAAVLAIIPAASLQAEVITGQYVEARNTDVWTGPCFANAEINLTGKNAVIGWKIEKGTLDGVKLDGLGVVAVIQANDTLGIEQQGEAKAVLIVDAKADKAQHAALVKLAKQQGGDLVKNVVAVETAAVDLTICECKGGTCAKLDAGKARIETRCLDGAHDKMCGNESEFFPPLTKGVKAQAAVASEHSFSGKGLNQTWKDIGRRSAYVGRFEIR